MADTVLTKDDFTKMVFHNRHGREMTDQELIDWREQQEQVRLRLVAEYSSSPLYQAKAAKDPEYWNNFYIGIIRGCK